MREVIKFSRNNKIVILTLIVGFLTLLLVITLIGIALWFRPLWVDPILSPTDQLIQTVRVYLGSGEMVTVTTESGNFTVSGNFGAMSNPALVNVTLLPDTTHNLTVTGRVKASVINGCPFGGYTLSTQMDRNGQPLIIIQQRVN